MTHHEDMKTYFCEICEDFFDAAQGEHSGEGHDVANCPACQAKGRTHCPACGMAVVKSDDKKCPGCGAAYK
jgi:rubrerythrin